MAVREFRFVGTSAVGEAIRGNIYAPSRRAAARRIKALSDKHNFVPGFLEERHTYLYKVRHLSGKTVLGEQKAYSSEEVRLALERMGLVVVRVQRKLFSFQLRPSSTDLVLFVRLSANMLRRRLPFDEILALLITDTRSRSLKQIIRDLNSDLRGGVDPQQAFMKHQHMLGKFAAYMLGLAATSGNMANMFEATAKYLERKDEFQKNVRSAMVTPAVTLVAAIAAFVWFVWYIIPSMAELFVDYNVKLPPLTSASLTFAHWMDSNYWWVFLLLLILIAAGIGVGRTARGRFIIHSYMIRIPYIGDLLHKLNLEVFCRVFAVLYTGSGENDEVMRISAEATGNTYLERQIKTITIPAMMARGTDLIVAMEASGVFLPMMIARFRSGAETGGVRESADEMADFYENETTLKMQTAVETIKTVVAVVISILVGILTLLSAETALIQPTASDIMFKR